MGPVASLIWHYDVSEIASRALPFYSRVNLMSDNSKQQKVGLTGDWLGEANRPRYFTKYTLVGIPYLLALGAWKSATLLLWGVAVGAVLRLAGQLLGYFQPLTGDEMTLAYVGLGWACIGTVLKLLSLKRKRDFAQL